MEWLIEVYRHELTVFAFVLARLGGLVIAGPLFTGRAVPVRIRVGLAVCLAAVISPVHWQVSSGGPQPPAELAVAAGCEVALGVAFGTALSLFLAGARLAGQLISSLTGTSLVHDFSGEGEAMPAFAWLLDLTATAIFLAFGGHRQVLAALLDTFQRLPPGTARPTHAWLEGLTAVAMQSFELGLRLAAPVVVSLLLAHLAVACVSRTVPQLNAMGIGFSLNGLIALAALSMSLGVVTWVFQDQLEAAITTVRSTMTGTWNV